MKDYLNRISIIPREDLIALAGIDITIHWRMTAEQFLGRKTEASA